jgi:hypothetical protein
MSRTPDPQGLSLEEAADFRTVMGELRFAKDVTYEQLSTALGWNDVRRVTNFLSAGRPLSAPIALEILRAIDGIRTRRRSVTAADLAAANAALHAHNHRAVWLRDGRAAELPPLALIPRTQAGVLARRLAVATAFGDDGKRRLTVAKQGDLAAVLESALRRESMAMARAWAQATVSIVQLDMRDDPRRHLARDLVYKVAALTSTEAVKSGAKPTVKRPAKGAKTGTIRY